MECCYFSEIWSADESQVTLQNISDAVTAMAYFSVPLQLIYFIRISTIFPDRWQFLYFGTVTFLCGATFLANLWTSQKSKTAALVIVAVKLSTAGISWLTAVIMVHVIPYLLSLQKREIFLRNRVEVLCRQLSVILCEEESRRLIFKLIREIRSTLDGQSIAKSTVVGLGRIFDLEECALWFPTQTNRSLQLSYTLSDSIPVGSTIPLKLSVVNDILNNIGAVRISPTCPLVRTFAWRSHPPEVVAIRVPLLNVLCTKPDAVLDTSSVSYAVMVLVLPSDNIRKFRANELELVEAVAQEVATALAHASAFTESTMACDHLMKQNSSLELEVQSIEMAFHASSGLVSGILRQMSTPLHALTAFSSLLLETSLTPQQRAMVEAVVKSSTRLETQMKNQRGLSILEDGTLEFKTKVFNVSVAFKQVINFIKPTAAVKKLSLSLVLAPDFPVYAVGDQEKLMQVVLNVVGNAVKFTEKGCVSVLASVAHPESYRDWRPFKLFLVSSEDHFYLKVQVDDFGHGISPQKIRKVFNRFKDPEIASNQSINSGLGLAISKRLLDLMGGRIWVESDGLGMGCTATFILKLGTFRGTSAT